MTDLERLAEACENGADYCRELSANEKPIWSGVRDYRWEEPLRTADELEELARALRAGRVTVEPETSNGT